MANTLTHPPAVAVKALKDAIASSWARETSADPDHWAPENPAWGQCAVTALVLQEFLDGELLRTEVSGTSHYWNRLPAGEEIDLTREQFGAGVVVSEGETRSREYILSFPETLQRYTVLRHEVMSRLGRSN
jgi:hypothetical protein